MNSTPTITDNATLVANPETRAPVAAVPTPPAPEPTTAVSKPAPAAPKKAAVKAPAKAPVNAVKSAARPTAKPADKPAAKKATPATPGTARNTAKTAAGAQPVAAAKPATPVAPVKAVKAVKATVPVKARATAAGAPTPETKAAQPPKFKKTKLVRDRFTIPQDEHDALTALKKRAAKLAVPTKKSGLLRAGIRLLAGLSDTAFAAALRMLPGKRPAADKVSRD